MSPGVVADFARFRAGHPLWSVRRTGPGYRAFSARKGGVLVYAGRAGAADQRGRGSVAVMSVLAWLARRRDARPASGCWLSWVPWRLEPVTEAGNPRHAGRQPRRASLPPRHVPGAGS